jgi:DNA-binding LytR/AlgR family response regulator
MGRPIAVQAAAHCALAILFTLLWFWLLMVLLGVTAGRNAVDFSVRPFLGPAAAWQLFQGLFVYGMIAMTVHAEALAEQARSVTANAATQEPKRPRLFIKQEDEIRPLNPDRIILIRGADDYSEVVTPEGTHLVRMTLAVLAEKLGEGFIRIHRSCLVNLDRITRAEPAGGGRMLLHMESGEMVHTSRAGTKLLRDHLI